MPLPLTCPCLSAAAAATCKSVQQAARIKAHIKMMLATMGELQGLSSRASEPLET